MTKYDGISTLIDLLNNEKINKVADWITYPKTVSKKWVDFIRSVSHSIKATFHPIPLSAYKKGTGKNTVTKTVCYLTLFHLPRLNPMKSRC